jgi:hypothetical protein
MLGDGQVLQDADHGHHDDAHPKLLDNIQQILGWWRCCRVGCRRCIETEQPGQLEMGQTRLDLKKNKGN